MTNVINDLNNLIPNFLEICKDFGLFLWHEATVQQIILIILAWLLLVKIEMELISTLPQFVKNLKAFQHKLPGMLQKAKAEDNCQRFSDFPIHRND